jgi:3D-(3,5/4)-trihydroxycyclohexane-1,2-dione acylhydrolase (decyclizing)
VAAAARLLRAARRPLIVAGGGVWHSAAEDALRALADGCAIPVVETSAGKGVHPGAVGGLGVNGTGAANALAREADVVLCAGTRLSDFTTASHSLFQAPGVRFVGVNVCAADAHKLGALPVVADARLALVALADALTGWRAPEQPVRAAMEAWERELAPALVPRAGERVSQGEILRALNEQVRPGDWVVAAAGSPPGDLLKLWRAVPGSHVHLEFAFSCMGHELPAGLGLRLADPDAGEIFVVIGDGTYLMAAGELATAVHERLKVTVVLLVNGGFQSIHALQRATTASSLGTEFPELDYAANARTFGWRAWEAHSAGDLAGALDAARAATGPAIVVVRVDPRRTLPSAGAFWDLGVAEVSSRPEAAAAAAGHARGRAAQRHYGWVAP